MIEEEKEKYKKIIDELTPIYEANKSDEPYNIFEILRLETAEDRTHSAFIEDLLNPKGKHKQDDCFLQLFLETIDKTDFDILQVDITKEFHIGEVKIPKKPIDLKKVSGGRVDIYLRNNKDESICIENKINAALQHYQLQRYLNHNPENNFVILLNLKKSNPIDYQIREQDQERFLHISYKDEIIAWLEKCLEDLQDTDYLKCIIDQYIQILCNLTGRIRKMEKELKKTLFDNIEEVNLIANNYDRILSEVKVDFQKKLLEHITSTIKKIDSQWSVVIGAKADTNGGNIWINHATINDKNLCFGMENFSGKGTFATEFFIGIFSSKRIDLETLETLKNTESCWRDKQSLTDKYSKPIDFSDAIFIAKLYKDEKYKTELAGHVAEQITNYFNIHKQTIIDGYFNFNKKRK